MLVSWKDMILVNNMRKNRSLFLKHPKSQNLSHANITKGLFRLNAYGYCLEHGFETPSQLTTCANVELAGETLPSTTSQAIVPVRTISHLPQTSLPLLAFVIISLWPELPTIVPTRDSEPHGQKNKLDTSLEYPQIDSTGFVAYRFLYASSYEKR